MLSPDAYRGYTPKERKTPGRRLGKGLALTAAMTLVLSPFMAGCSKDSTLKPEMFLTNCDKIASNVYTAAGSVLIARVPSSNQELTNSNISGFGHGGLYDISGQLWLATAEHVVKDVPAGQNLVAAFCNPDGTNFSFALPTEDGAFTTFFDANNDRLIGYPIDASNTSLYEAVQNGTIAPLVVRDMNSVQEGQPLGVVNENGELTHFTYAGVDERKGRYEFIEGGTVCAGQSGSSVLVLNDQGQPTGESLGQFAAATSHFSDCSDKDLAFIPFQTS